MAERSVQQGRARRGIAARVAKDPGRTVTQTHRLYRREQERRAFGDLLGQGGQGDVGAECRQALRDGHDLI